MRHRSSSRPPQRVSPFRLTTALSNEELARLHRAAVEVLAEWVERLRGEAGDAFPERVTAFREGMAVHGRFGQPCPVCGSPVQRVVYAANEANYCARCQTGGRHAARATSSGAGDRRRTAAQPGCRPGSSMLVRVQRGRSSS